MITDKEYNSIEVGDIIEIIPFLREANIVLVTQKHLGVSGYYFSIKFDMIEATTSDSFPDQILKVFKQPKNYICKECFVLPTCQSKSEQLLKCFKELI